ncbi:zinc finger protein 43-like [Cloeon dipterum]|uniref:zinc finger protein 43-like n=1 Tax=Cloeon dipterum TaxID=197152 RepID=UPI0032201962
MKPKEGKKPIQKPLCRLCQCPTSDGHVLASQVDRIKLRKWAMEASNLTEEDENLPVIVEKDALICYFCIWLAEFEDEPGDDSVHWWPKNLDLDENARLLRENYSAGEVDQCWVQLEKFDLTKYEKEIPKKRKYVSGVCFYCGNRFDKLMQHIRQMHKEAIKCGFWGCRTYFHTEEDKEQHMQQVIHERPFKPRGSNKVGCKFCEIGKLYSSVNLWRKHMKCDHPELPVACMHVGCKEYFKSKSKMTLHYNSAHSRGKDLYQCKQCEYFTLWKSLFKRHIEVKHMPKIFKCDDCVAKYGSKRLLEEHFIKCHTFVKCESCGLDVASSCKSRHGKPMACSRCKLGFKCLGLYQLHRNSCKQTLLHCKECGKTFTRIIDVNRHLNEIHTKSAILQCEHCDHSTVYKNKLWVHIQRKHLPKTIKCGECNKLFASEFVLDIHKQKSHSFLRCAECAQEFSRSKLPYHQIVKTCRHCKCKFKCQGLLDKHKKSCVLTMSNAYICDMCPKTYSHKIRLYYHIISKHIEK